MYSAARCHDDVVPWDTKRLGEMLSWEYIWQTCLKFVAIKVRIVNVCFGTIATGTGLISNTVFSVSGNVLVGN